MESMLFNTYLFCYNIMRAFLYVFHISDEGQVDFSRSANNWLPDNNSLSYTVMILIGCLKPKPTIGYDGWDGYYLDAYDWLMDDDG